MTSEFGAACPFPMLSALLGLRAHLCLQQGRSGVTHSSMCLAIQAQLLPGSWAHPSRHHQAGALVAWC